MKTPTTLKNRFNFLFLFMILGMGNVWGQTSSNVYVKFISQSVEGCGTSGFSNAFCGHTSSEMIISTIDSRQPAISNIENYNILIENNFFNSIHNECGTGTPNPTMLNWLIDYKGYNVKWYGDSNYYNSTNGCSGELSIYDLFDLLNQNKYVIVQTYIGMNAGTSSNPIGTHWMVLRQIDFNNNKIYVNDPGKSEGNNKSYNLQDFINNWTASQHPAGNQFTNTKGAPRKRCLVVSKDIEINQSLPIYAGTKTNPKPFELFFPKTDIGDETPTLITDIKVNGVTLPHSLSSGLVVPTLRNSHQPPYAPIYSVVIEPNNNAFSSLSNNNSYSISFKVTTSSNNTYTFSGSNQVYLKDRTSLDTSITGVNAWMAPYVRNGVGWGLFTGNGGVSSTNFGATDTLKRAQAAVVIVRAAIYAHAPNRAINTSNASNYFTDVPASGGEYSYAYIYAHTLRNWGVIGAGTSFNPDGNITMKEFARWLDLAMGFNSTDVAPQSLQDATLSRIVFNVTGNNASNYLASLNKLSKIITYESPSTGVNVFETFYTFSDFSSLPPSLAITGTITVNGELTMTRGKMAKFITNAFKYAHKKNTGSYPSFRLNSENATTIDLNNVTIIGDKFENADIPVGSEPVPPSQVTFSCNSGGHINMYYENDYDTSGNPKFFYWSMEKNGATLTSETDSHRKVRFTAPTVSSPNQWKVYSYTANNKGKFKETIITINVGGSSSGSDVYPTQQATNLQITANNNITNYIGLSWTRGNGQLCMVTATELPNTQSLPQDGQSYSHNQNFNYAPSIGDTKIVYIGTNSTANIISLQQNINYKFTVYEFNGTSYNVSNAPSVTGQIEPLPPYSVAIQYSPSIIIIGEEVTFCVDSEHNCNTVWTNSGGSASSNGTSCQNVVFSNPGTYTISVLATECVTDTTDTDSVTINVYNPNQLEPDFIVQNLSSNKTAASIGNSITVNYSVTNIGLVKGYLTDMSYYISNDNILSVDDILVLNDPFYTSYQINPNNSLSLSKTFSVPSSVTLGNKFIIVKADGQENEIETNENNNTSSIALSIVDALPDLIITNATLPNGTTYASGVAIPINVSISNIGTSSYITDHFIDVYLSTSGNILDSNNWNQFVLDLSYGNYPSNITINPVFSSLIPNGTYTLLLEVDHAVQLNNLVPELDETNNRFTVGTITISNPNQPTVQVSNAAITNKTNNSVTLNWDNGNGNGRLVLARETNRVYNDPVDNNTYVSNSVFPDAINFGGAKVVYNGNGNSVTITGLNTGKTYFFNIYEYKTTGNNIDYLQLNPQKVIAHLNNLSIPNWEQITSETVGFSNLNIFNSNLNILSVEDGRMIKSTNDGLFFTEVNYDKGYNQELGGVTDSRLKFINDNLAFSIRSTKILKSIDGGLNWENQNINLYGNKSFSDMYIFNSEIGYICSRGYGADYNGVIYKTVDGGNNWNAIYFAPNRLRGIKFFDENIGYCVGDNGTILYTNNGGQTWVEKNIDMTNYPSLSIRDIHFINQNSVVAAGYSTVGGVIFKSENAGNTWLNILTTDEIYNFSHIIFKNSSIGYASTRFSNNFTINYIYKTTDGGNTWNQFIIPVDCIPIDIILNNNEVWLSTKESTGSIYSTFKFTEPTIPNSISVTNSDTDLCVTEMLDMVYSIEGNYNNDNYFNVELSGINGDFSNPVSINSFTNTGSGNIQCVLPQNLVSGNYKTRVVSSNPVVLSNESNSFSIVAGNESAVSITPSNSNLCPNQSVTLTTNPINGGTSPTYTWKRNGQIVGENSNEITILDPSNDDVFWVEMLSSETCSSNVPSVSNAVSVNITLLDEIFIQAIDNILAASTDVGVQWIRNGQPIAGATSQFYEAIQTGFYQFSVTINGCTILSEIHALTSLSNLNDITLEKNGIKAFPNPFENTLTITAENTIISFTMYDLQGRVIHTSKVNKLETTVEMQDIPQAVYILEVVTEKGKEYLKIVKN